MNQLHVTTSTHPYTITIDSKLRYRLQDFISKEYSSIFVITDTQVAPLYLKDVLKALKGNHVIYSVLPSGESTKSIDHYYQLQTMAMENHLDRQSLIIALGGGVIGDLAGFVASTFMRGIDYIQVPTTILAHDSSVGGKVAINHELGKNMIGNFYPPVAVVYDIETVQSLPVREIRSGYAELVKEAFIADADFLERLFTNSLHDITDKELQQHLCQGIKIKANIVEADEREASIRKYLNFGHTLAHAVESTIGYGHITHGEAVSIGMLFALHISEQLYKKDLGYKSLLTWLRKNNYPISLYDINIETLVYSMKLDKKSTNQEVQMVLIKNIGEPIIRTMEETALLTYLHSFKKELTTI